MALPRLLWVWLLVAGTQGVRDGDMRLANGDAPNEGRVEIFYGGQWGTVCDNLWDLVDASVVCRALGFENATEALGRAAFGPGTGPIMLDEVQCSGTESSLANCSSLGWLRSKCRHNQDAGVICSNETGGAHTLDLSGALPAALAQIFDSQRGCDLTVAVKADGAEPLSLCAHSLILTSNPEAQALWSEPGSTVTMEVDAECLPVATDFIRYFYSRRIDVSLPNVKCLHKLASVFGAQQLQAYCAGLFAFLLPEDLSFQTALDLHAYALAMQDPTLEELCVQFLAWNFEALTGAEAWPRVPTALLRALLSRSELAVPSELALLTALDAWSREKGAAPGDVEGLVREVRFPMIPPEDLFQLQSNLSLYRSHRALFQEQTLQALEFHTVPLPPWPGAPESPPAALTTRTPTVMARTPTSMTAMAATALRLRPRGTSRRRSTPASSSGPAASPGPSPTSPRSRAAGTTGSRAPPTRCPSWASPSPAPPTPPSATRTKR
uniref:Galectin 3 binding protein n=1 Tax=Myotis myotis TaxID=51298 RepID=A0A7J7T5K3_MYOMY|nr:galectin 3 binding protein [Myotis myotis]